MSVIDLRSDTVTRPTEVMRKAMAEAEVGDDLFGDDPTVHRLQERAAEIMGKEAALYAASGTMCNQIALRTLVRHGHEAIAEATAHVITVEKISAATLSGVTYRPIPGDRGLITAEQVTNALRPDLDPLRMRVVDLVAVENTHQVGGGRVMPLETLREIHKVAQDAGLHLYLDGARIFNASVASGVDVADFAAEADAMMFCLSKGLGAPIGSLLCGPADFIDEARRVRTQFGGGWRQAGVIAAAGLVALEEGPKRLHQDHENATRLAEGVGELFPGAVDVEGVETNIMFVNHDAVGMAPPEIVARLQIEGVLAGIVTGRVRMVTHRDVSSADIDRALGAWKTLAS
ncbi:MAG TPA: GntG family PLP-dependent aldolase [Actinomycetota bacterium]|nr:GntG family PLP-dependent aldolase [Actinomycetota bacterium]